LFDIILYQQDRNCNHIFLKCTEKEEAAENDQFPVLNREIQKFGDGRVVIDKRVAENGFIGKTAFFSGS
jgi:hypothetical protein